MSFQVSFFSGSNCFTAYKANVFATVLHEKYLISHSILNDLFSSSIFRFFDVEVAIRKEFKNKKNV